MDIECPHCGAKHRAEQGDFGKTTKCLGCDRQFTVNHGFVCAKDGIVTWYASDQLAKMKQCAEAGVWVIIVGCGFLVWADSVYTAEETGLVLTDIEFIVVFAINLIKSFLSWQGILGLIILVLGVLLLAASKTRCSQCSEHGGLMDLNSPMGWKLYNSLYPNEKQCRVPQTASGVLCRQNHVAPRNDETVEAADGLSTSTVLKRNGSSEAIRRLVSREYMAAFKRCVYVIVAVFAVLLFVGYVCHAIFADKVSLLTVVPQTSACSLTRDLLGESLDMPNMSECYVSEPAVLLSRSHKFTLENELPTWAKSLKAYDCGVRVAQVFRGEGVVIHAPWNGNARAYVKTSHNYEVGETILPGIYVAIGWAKCKNFAGGVAKLAAFLQMDSEEAERQLEKLVSELDREATRRIDDAEEAKRRAIRREAEKRAYAVKIAKAKEEAETVVTKRRTEEESARLQAEEKRRRAEGEVR